MASRRLRMTRLQWLYPGLGMKRRVLAVCAGGALIGLSGWLALGVVVTSGRRHDVGGTWITGHVALAVGLVVASLLAGLVVVALGARSLYRFARAADEPGVLALRTDARLARGPRIVAIGGGTGLSVLLSGLKRHSSNLTAVVTVADDGGSSGLLRSSMGTLPPGDIRSCLVALADDESLMSRLFQYRFPQDGGLQGHSFGNLFVAALADVTGDFERAVQESTTVLKVRGRVLPATLESVTLHAELEGGERVAGESTITASKRLPLRVWLEPGRPPAVPQALEALAAADLVVLGPGSVYTSIVPNLLIPEVREALKRTRARVVYVCNVMTQPGETDDHSAADHVRALCRHGVAGMIDVVLVNDTPVSEELAAAYRAEGAAPVAVDDGELATLGVRVVHAPLAREGDFFRHDAAKLADAVLRLAAP
ncbi:MAG TPA: uridine diphosphate-N-acetylglucosamine-binding protein YvcK [Thermoleophilia bacterium]|nr:uridine diphosphate-N-acetylglucosamine-binding protein YvcK [Thermoleophilia bacterium]